MQYAVILFFLILVQVSPDDVVANCEVAPRGFHTIAEYDSRTESGDWLLRFHRYDKGIFVSSLRNEAPQYAEQVFNEMKNGDKPFTIRYKNFSFVLPKEKLDRITFESHLWDDIAIPNTILYTKALPDHGYARYEVATRTLWLSVGLDISKTKRTEIADQSLLKDIASRNIFLAPSAAVPISISDVLHMKIDSTIIGKDVNTFDVMIVTLR